MHDSPTQWCRRLRRLLLLLLAASLCTGAGAAEADAAAIRQVQAGTQAVLLRAPCINAPPGRNDITLLSSGNEQLAVFSAPPSPYGTIAITLEVGDAAAVAGVCAGRAKKSFVISEALPPPSTAPEVLAKAFTILMTAFVVALLLEQAFALLFNWRLFLELAVGKAWRTPIMFIAAYALSRQMGMDLITELADAYDPVHVHKNNWLTQALTAAILAGGSVGVNHLLTSLGFRSQVRPDMAKTLDITQAWLSITVLGNSDGVKICIDEDPAPAAHVPTLAGTVGAASIATRLKDLFFPNSSRFPRAGGYLLSTTKAYRIYAITKTGKLIDIDSQLRGNAAGVPAYRFASRAIVDIPIRIA